MERVWQLTQEPDVHQRWDLRFSRIEYLPRPNPEEPQRFLYETRIGFGLSIRGTGESIATRTAVDGSATSSLRFASEDALSLIREGAGYWRYIPTADGVRFLTWYDYRTRFGFVGALANRVVVQPLMGWATAWSFDCMRRLAEEEIPPEVSIRFSLVHAICRVGLAFVWMWHGLVPKLMFHDADELRMLQQSGLHAKWLPWAGGAEVLLGLLTLLLWRWRGMFALQIVLMMLALTSVVWRSSEYVTHAFNPVTLNVCVVLLAVLGWVAAKYVPSAARCLRIRPVGEENA
jgi:hypothetical protein